MANNYIAIILKIFSVIFLVLMDVLIKKLSADFNTFQIVFFRCFFGILPVLIMMLITKSSLKTKKINLHLLRALNKCKFIFFVFRDDLVINIIIKTGKIPKKHLKNTI